MEVRQRVAEVARQMQAAERRGVRPGSGAGPGRCCHRGAQGAPKQPPNICKTYRLLCPSPTARKSARAAGGGARRDAGLFCSSGRSWRRSFRAGARARDEAGGRAAALSGSTGGAGGHSARVARPPWVVGIGLGLGGFFRAGITWLAAYSCRCPGAGGVFCLGVPLASRQGKGGAVPPLRENRRRWRGYWGRPGGGHHRTDRADRCRGGRNFPAGRGRWIGSRRQTLCSAGTPPANRTGRGAAEGLAGEEQDQRQANSPIRPTGLRCWLRRPWRKQSRPPGTLSAFRMSEPGGSLRGGSPPTRVPQGFGSGRPDGGKCPGRGPGPGPSEPPWAADIRLYSRGPEKNQPCYGHQLHHPGGGARGGGLGRPSVGPGDGLITGQQQREHGSWRPPSGTWTFSAAGAAAGTDDLLRQAGAADAEDFRRRDRLTKWREWVERMEKHRETALYPVWPAPGRPRRPERETELHPSLELQSEKESLENRFQELDEVIRRDIMKAAFA